MAIQFPTTLAQGDYEVVVQVDTGAALAELNESNNAATFVQSVSVAPPFSDPTLAFSPTTVIPENVIADGRSLPLKFDVTNQGNVTIPGGSTGSLTIVAHNIDTDQDTTLKVFTVSLAGIGSGKLKTFSVTPTILSTLTAGHYTILATLETGIAGDVVENNSDSNATTMTVSAPYYNLSALPADSLIAGAVVVNAPTPGFINVGIKNLSNTFLPAGTRANVQLALRPTSAIGDSQDINIGSGNMSVSKLAAGATQKARIGATIPAKKPNGDPLALGDYVVVTKVTPVGSLTEITSVDNESTGSTITVADPFVDLAIVSASNGFPTPSPAGSSSTGVVVLKNLGNLTVQANVTIQFFATPTNDIDDGTSIGSRTFFVLLPPGASTPNLTTALTLDTPANGFLSADYTIFARIDPVSFSDAVAGNNERAAGTLVVSSQSAELKIGGATNPFGNAATGGSVGVGKVTIWNSGSGISAGTVTITYYASLDNTLDGSDIVIGTQDVEVALGSAKFTTPVEVTLTLPNPGITTTYRLIAKITSSLTVDNHQNDNITPVIGVVDVSPVVG